MKQAALNLDKYSDNKPKTIMRGGLSLKLEEKIIKPQRYLSEENELLNELVGKQPFVKENISSDLFSISVQPAQSSNEYNLLNRGSCFSWC